MRIGIIGVGYVGLVTGACLSDFGHHVVCFDKNQKKIKDLRKLIIPIYENGLKKLVKKNINANRLSFEFELDKKIKDLDAIFIAVGTPTNSKRGEVDLDAVFSAIERLSTLIMSCKVIVIKSTVPVGTNKLVQQKLLNKSINNIEVVSNPEFLREGSAIEDFMRPDRVVIGCRSTKAKSVMTTIYKPLYLREFPLMFTDPENAELIKYASNAFLATKITFINEIAELCEKVGADVKEVAKGMGLDKRIGNKFLHAGPGFGGSCFPKDTLALVEMGKTHGAPQKITKTVIDTNIEIKQNIVRKAIDILDGSVKDKVICILGVTFKPNTDDIRDSPSLTIVPALQEGLAKIRLVDPKGFDQGKNVFKDVDWIEDVYQAVIDANLLIILTEWNAFRALDLEKISKSMSSPFLLDLRNIYSFNEAISCGFKKYAGVGR